MTERILFSCDFCGKDIFTEKDYVFFQLKSGADFCKDCFIKNELWKQDLISQEIVRQRRESGEAFKREKIIETPLLADEQTILAVLWRWNAITQHRRVNWMMTVGDVIASLKQHSIEMQFMHAMNMMKMLEQRDMVAKVKNIVRRQEWFLTPYGTNYSDKVFSKIASKEAKKK